MPAVNAQYCQLQSSVASRDVNSCEQGKCFNVRSGGGLALMLCMDRRKIPPVIIMTLHCFLTKLGAQLRDNGFWFEDAVGVGLNFVHDHELQAFYLQGNFSPVLNSCFLLFSASSVDVHKLCNIVAIYKLCYSVVSVASSIRHSFCLIRPRPVGHPVHSASLSNSLSITMVRSGKRHCPEGRRNNSLHPPAGFAMETAPEPINPSLVHEAGPSAGSGRKPLPNSAFQTMHFKFQSNLHHPLVTAHITLILPEEENLVTPLACIAPNPSPSSENSSDKDSMEIWEKEKVE